MTACLLCKKWTAFFLAVGTFLLLKGMLLQSHTLYFYITEGS